MNCLIVDDMHPSIGPMLAELGIATDYQPALSRAEILAAVGRYEGLLIRSKTRVDAELLAAAPRLRFVGRAGAGLDNVDVAEARRRNVQVLHAAEGNRDAVAEHAVGMLLVLLNRMLGADQQVRAGQWLREANRGYELCQLTVGIVGYGYMGQAFARRLSGFGCRVLAYDKYAGVLDPTFAQSADLPTLQAEADVLSLHVPLTDETRGMVNTDFLQQFARPIWLLNTARGEVLRLADLADALENGRVRGAALDVLENEHFHRWTTPQRQTFERLRRLDNVLFTPHVAGWTQESYCKINHVLTAKIRRFLTEKS